MAIFSLHHSAIGRTTHQAGTAGAHVAYVTRRRAASAVLTARMPVAAPGAPGPARAWFDAEEIASRKNGRVADRLMIALPIELNAEQRLALVRGFAEAATAGRAPWLAAIHANGKDALNPHTHILIRDRDPATGRRAVGLSEKGSTDQLRALWEQHANAALEAAGAETRIDRRSLAAQGVDRVPEIHIGPNVVAMDERGVRPESRERFDATGRQIRWPEIDDGRTRLDRCAEIRAEKAASVQAGSGEAPAGSEPRREDHDGHPGLAPGGSGNASGRGGDQERHGRNSGPAIAEGGRDRPGDGSPGADRTPDAGEIQHAESPADRDRAAARHAARIKATLARARAAVRLAEQHTRAQLEAARVDALGVLALSAQPINPPPNLVGARAALGRLFDDSSARLREAAAAKAAVEAARREREAVGGLWSWITGRRASAEIALTAAEAAASSTHGVWRAAQNATDAAVRTLESIEKSWDEKRSSLERERAVNREAAANRLAWLEKCNAVLQRHPELARRGLGAVEREAQRHQAEQISPGTSGPRRSWIRQNSARSKGWTPL